MSDASRCRRNGWTAGTQLRGTEFRGEAHQVTSVILLTAIGESLILAREIERDGKPIRRFESSWTLACRRWRRV